MHRFRRAEQHLRSAVSIPAPWVPWRRMEREHRWVIPSSSPVWQRHTAKPVRSCWARRSPTSVTPKPRRELWVSSRPYWNCSTASYHRWCISTGCLRHWRRSTPGWSSLGRPHPGRTVTARSAASRSRPTGSQVPTCTRSSSRHRPTQPPLRAGVRPARHGPSCCPRRLSRRCGALPRTSPTGWNVRAIRWT